MTIKHMLTGLVLASLGVAQAASLSEGFGNVANLTASGWTQVNNSAAPTGTGYFQGISEVFSAASGPSDSYAAANFLATSATSGAISSWLISPALSYANGDVVSFMVRTAGDNFLDTLEVRFSGAGASGNVGTTTASVGDFSTLLGTFSSSVDTGWVMRSYTVSGLTGATSGRVGFRYVVSDVATAGNYIGIDSLSITPVPEPATTLLMGLGLAGLLARRRFCA